MRDHPGIAPRQVEDVRSRLKHDLQVTGRGAHAHMVDEVVEFALTFVEDAAWFTDKVVEDLQQRMHDEFVDTVWPQCPHHRHHPLWLHDGAWVCEQDGVSVAPLGALVPAAGSVSGCGTPTTRTGGSMKRVTGIGGIFFNAKDAPALQAWYKRHLGIDVQDWGGAAFTWTGDDGKTMAGTSIWSIGSASRNQFAPSTAPFMINYRVDDLHALVNVLREEGCNVLEKIDESEYGKFAWVIDPEGNKVELWQPPAGQ